MGSYYMEATQINYRRDENFKTVDQKLQELSETSAIDTDIAPVFKSTNTYAPGDLVYYRNKLYRFNVEHTGAWAAGDVTATDVTTEVSSLRSGLIDVNSNLTSLNNKLMRTSATFIANKWYKISTYTLNSAIWLDHRFLIAFNGVNLKFGRLRSVPDDGFNNNDLSITQVFGTAKQLGFIVSNDHLSVDIYINSNIAGKFVYQVLTEGGEGDSVVFHDPILTDLTDADMTVYN